MATHFCTGVPCAICRPIFEQMKLDVVEAMRQMPSFHELLIGYIEQTEEDAAFLRSCNIKADG